MNRIEILKQKVSDLYQSKNPDRSDWADWLYENHVFVVAENAEKFSGRFGGNRDLAVAAAMLHDIADSVMSRGNPEHEKRSVLIATKLLEEAGFSSTEIETILNDAVRYHSCRNGESPQTLEGRVMATADAVAHLNTDFYDHAIEASDEKDSWEDIKAWGLEKIDRDFNKKIFFDEVRKEVESDYRRLKQLFSK